MRQRRSKSKSFFSGKHKNRPGRANYALTVNSAYRSDEVEVGSLCGGQRVMSRHSQQDVGIGSRRKSRRSVRATAPHYAASWGGSFWRGRWLRPRQWARSRWAVSTRLLSASGAWRLVPPFRPHIIMSFSSVRARRCELRDWKPMPARQVEWWFTPVLCAESGMLQDRAAQWC